MKTAALLLTLLAAFFFAASCRSPRTASTATCPGATAPTYAPSPHRILGYVLDVDEARGFAIVDLTAEPMPTELHASTALTVRSRDLKETARLTATRFLRGHTLGATIITGRPAIGDEVVLMRP